MRKVLYIAVVIFGILGVFLYSQIKDGECDGQNELCIPVIYIGNTQHSWQDVKPLIERLNNQNEVEGWVQVFEAAKDDNNRYFEECSKDTSKCNKNWGRGWMWMNIPQIKLAGVSTTLGFKCELKLTKEQCPQDDC